MKKYLKPQTETIEIEFCSVLCHSNDGQGSQNAPGTPSSDKGGPIGMPIYR